MAKKDTSIARLFGRRSLALLAALSALLVGALAFAPEPAALAGSSATASRQANPLSLPDGFDATAYARGLKAPTAMAFGPAGKLWLTELNGGENQGDGQVAVIGQPGASPSIALRHLDKPTGLVWRKHRLYIVAGRSILRTRLGDDGRLEKPAAVVSDLPYNGRSEGQIDLLADGRLLFEASGDTRQPHASGLLLTLTPGQKPNPWARGLKNAYAHARDPGTGRIYATDIEADPVDGKAAPDEINLVRPGQDYGWPGCYGDRRPASNWGGSKRACAKTVPPVIDLPPHATPTGLAYYNGGGFPQAYRDALYVALWNGRPPRIMRITLGEHGGRVTGRASRFIAGKGFRPIDVLPGPHGGLLVLDFGAGVVYRITSDPGP